MISANKTALQDSSELKNNKRTPASIIWGLNFSDYFPSTLAEDFTVSVVSYEEGNALINRFFPEIYNLKEAGTVSIISGHNKQQDRDEELQKRKYYEYFGDYFVFRSLNGSFAGLGIGTFLDWSSYYFRNMVVMPEFRGKNLYQEFFAMLCHILKAHKVKRIEGDVSPTNRHHLHVLNRMGYTISGLKLEDRWGAMVHVTKFLDEAAEDQFGRNFSGTYASDKKQNGDFATKNPVKIMWSSGSKP